MIRRVVDLNLLVNHCLVIILRPKVRTMVTSLLCASAVLLLLDHQGVLLVGSYVHHHVNGLRILRRAGLLISKMFLKSGSAC